MSEPNRDRGKLFAYAEKQKPSQPAFHGDCTIDGVAYEIRGWHREEQMAISLAPPRVDTNKFPPDVFRGNLDPAPPKPVAAKGKGKKGKPSEPEPSDPTIPAWTGIIVSDETAYVVRAFEKQGKSGIYWTLAFEKTEKPARDTAWDDAAPEATE